MRRASAWALEPAPRARPTRPAPTAAVPTAAPLQALANSLFSVWDSLGKISGFAFGALDVQALLPGLADGNVVPGRRALFAD